VKLFNLCLSVLISLLLASPAWAATPTVDKSTEHSQTNVSASTGYSHTRNSTCTPAGSDVAIIFVGSQDSQVVHSRVTYGGNAATQPGSTVTFGGTDAISMWIYKNPPDGTSAVVATFPEVVNGHTIITTTDLQRQSNDKHGAVQTGQSSGTAVSISVTSAVGELVIDGAYAGSGRSLTDAGFCYGSEGMIAEMPS
jgi:hypothetical protein